MRYIVTADRPTYCRGEERACFECGDVIEVNDDRTPDSDGDLFGTRISDGMAGHIIATALRPVSAALDERVIRAAFAAAGVLPAQIEAILAEARRAAS